jgi:hypothetical protein
MEMKQSDNDQLRGTITATVLTSGILYLHSASCSKFPTDCTAQYPAFRISTLIQLSEVTEKNTENSTAISGFQAKIWNPDLPDKKQY